MFGFEDTSTSTATEDGNNNNNVNNVSVWTAQTIGFLTLSGAIGIVVGDLAWLQALHLLGATRVLVVDTIKPFSAAVLGWWILGEDIKGVAFVGIGLTAVGVLIVSFEKDLDKGDDSGGHKGRKDQGSDEEEDDHADEHTDIIGNRRQMGNHQTHDSTTPIIPCTYKIDKGEDDMEIENTDEHNPNIPKEGDITGNSHGHGRFLRGYLLAVGNVLLDTYGSVLTKQHGRGVSTWAINLIRFGSSGFFMLLLSVAMRLHHRFKSYLSCGGGNEKSVRDGESRLPPGNGVVEVLGNQTLPTPAITTPWYTLPNVGTNAWVKVSTGVLFVTFVCPALSNYALFKIALALAITLGSITPLYALLLEWLLTHKRPTVRAATGATLAVGGVVFLSVWNV